ncbi:MAG: Cytochrom-c3-2 domain-containing protein [Burkholderia sp.]|jgi:hypothetical protein
MKKLLMVLIALSCSASFAAGIGEHHKALGLTAEPSQDQCTKCHGGYEALAQKTAALSPNPHSSHMGNTQCTACHQWSGEPRLLCNDCHSFPELEKALKSAK